ncbi:MAG: HD domain-containing protein [Clostridiales bacterium]|jgi:uncharacterized protein|nr:HD domain-containing protein [Clostridiales bacterium]
MSKDLYDEMFSYVKNLLSESEGTAANTKTWYSFRKRSDHIQRVFMWANRLIAENTFNRPIDSESVRIAAIFHDVGYAISTENSPQWEYHAENSAVIFNRYASENNYAGKNPEFVSYLVENHSRKNLLEDPHTPLELILLVEADLLDETGALSIVFDCLAEAGKPEANYFSTYNHVKNFSAKDPANNPMKTAKAKEFWGSKQKLISEFVNHLEFDLGINEQR